ncbi:L,D-transpeptidase [Paenirhodobacter sp.]|uniref:L,D-transpeptidase n=1 Tax=Paenirhodobacter sp. TaxID=1965326 RepID=UPI003B41F999
MDRRFLLTVAAVLHFGASPALVLAQTVGETAPDTPAPAPIVAVEPPPPAVVPVEPAPAVVPAEPAPAAPVVAAPEATVPPPPTAEPATPDIPATPDVAVVKPLVETPAPVKPKPAAARPIKDPPPQTSWPIAKRYYPTEVNVRPDLKVGSIIIVSDKYFLYHIIAPGKAMRYGVAVGRDELKFRGQAVVARKVRWPSWTPTPEMIERNPKAYKKYADGMPGGPGNPLGARALYLFQDGRDTAIRIHGTTEPSSIGRAVSNGCLRMVNDHVIALFNAVPIGTPVTVY